MGVKIWDLGFVFKCFSNNEKGIDEVSGVKCRLLFSLSDSVRVFFGWGFIFWVGLKSL